MSSLPPGYENSVVCPYNKSHIILSHRIQTHLIKCARSNPHIILEVCPFNTAHRFRSENIAAHIEECPDRMNFDRYLYSVETNAQQPAAPIVKAPPPKRNTNAKEESWDHFDTPTYNPQRYAMSSSVLRAPRLLAPAERRKFADAERQRLSGLNRGAPPQQQQQQ